MLRRFVCWLFRRRRGYAATALAEKPVAYYRLNGAGEWEPDASGHEFTARLILKEDKS